ncbi:MAG: DNA starvation/stationary phase protection protein [Pseudomonadota bacterium]|nr:ferritin [Rhodovulum sp. NI22]MDY6858661.1 DNA starvation/stationary phase protection protein [Pseudomonadota bacterium]
MAEALKTIAEPTTVETGVEDPKAVADSLAGVLSDTYNLLLKTHAYHWNVEGPLFYGIHHLTEEQYTDLFEATDVLAERMRALGQLAPMSIKAIVEGSVINDAPKNPTAHDMVEDLAGDHEQVATRLHELIEVAEKHSDDVTADLATARSAFHEKAAWMLRAIAKS